MSDDLYELFGKQEEEDESQDFLSGLIEPEEEDFFSSLKTAKDDDLFTPVQYEPIEEPEIVEPDEEIDGWDIPVGMEDQKDDRPEWVNEVMEGADFELEEDQPGQPISKKPSAIGTFFKTGGFIGKLASNDEAFGLTPQQRMILSIFLFVDVAILGCILLVLTGTIRF